MYLRVKCGQVFSLGRFWFVKLMSVHLVMATSPLEMQSLDHDPRLCLSLSLLCCFVVWGEVAHSKACFLGWKGILNMRVVTSFGFVDASLM